MRGLASASVWYEARATCFASISPGRSIPIRARLAVNTAEAAIDAAIAGVGIARVLSYQVASAVAERRLRILLADYEPEPLPVHLVHPAQASHPPLKLRRFLEFAAPRLKKTLAAIERALGQPPIRK